MTDRYAVIGQPIAHSKSPQIHAAFAAQTGEDIAYERIEAAPDDLADAVTRFRAGGGRGMNVTVPHKLAAYGLATSRSTRCAQAGAANTLRFDAHDRIFADNTDGAGLCRDLTRNLGLSLDGARVLVIGAGGAAQGVLGALLEHGAARLVVANRTLARAEALAEQHAGQAVEAVPLDAVGDPSTGFARTFDLVVNASASSLAGAPVPVAAEILADGAAAYDMMYGPAAQPFVDWALGAGAVVASDGLGMLVEQAAESFQLWRGVAPDTRPVVQSLRDAGQRR